LVFIPALRATDFSQWIPTDIEGYENCYEYGADIKLSTISTKDNIRLMVEKYDWSPKIIFESSLEGLNTGKIICHVLAIDNKDINKYKNKTINSYQEALQLFSDGINWAHIKIG
jgi:hypothetical protein